jgi:triphosphoribosyl-dephospho-CoA synthase
MHSSRVMFSQRGATRSSKYLNASTIGRAATLALYDELSLAPKPGLVSFVDSGSHADMDGRTFLRSLFALRRYFVQIAELGARRVPFGDLERCGQDAEARMLNATGGINTHRGAIFMLGLLCASVAAAQADAGCATPFAVRYALASHWGADLQARQSRVSALPGGLAAQRYGLRGASEEAALGFPIVFDVALPRWEQARSVGLAGPLLHLQVFFEVMAKLDDANLARRGGLSGLRDGQRLAQRFLSDGGVLHPDALDRVWSIHRTFVGRRLSPGGCADTLAAACFFDRLGLLP